MKSARRPRFSTPSLLLGGWLLFAGVDDLGVTLSQVVAEMVEKEGAVTAEVGGRTRLLD